MQNAERAGHYICKKRRKGIHMRYLKWRTSLVRLAVGFKSGLDPEDCRGTVENVIGVVAPNSCLSCLSGALRLQDSQPHPFL